ncbi:beta-ketoacyl synthase N-terminal-like domain-containing protein [Streptomyces sp. BI20]|uniref:beta-ketoacyl synthase N-terminal-like domain-containing protein n=1 Tax=Streptomyces sp. BI20 TaxID=3403460 RepID=UPI003C706B0C
MSGSTPSGGAAEATRVLVASAGATTCLAASAEGTWELVRKGKSGLGPLTLFPAPAAGRSGVVGEVAGLRTLTGGPRLAALAGSAIQEALAKAEAESGLTREQLTNAWVTVGVSLGDIFEQTGPDVELDHFWGEVAAELGLTGPVVFLSSACSSGTDAIGYGADLVATGVAPVVLAVGVDSLEPGKFMGHSGLKTMSPDRCRPYDSASDGTTVAEGAACLVLAAADLVTGTPFAEVRGWGSGTDIDSLTSPDLTGRGAARMLSDAISRAGATPGEIAHLNGHGSGTPVNDELEAAVYRAVFPEGTTVVSATKGALGHSLGATGAVEALLTACALRDGEAPPVAGLREPHERWAGIPIAVGTTHALPDATIGTTVREAAGAEEIATEPGRGPLLGASVTYGFGGANSCVVLEVRR